MATLLQELEVRQQKLTQLMGLVKELGLENLVAAQGLTLMAGTNEKPKQKREFSPEARERIRQAQKRRWEKKQREGKQKKPAAPVGTPKVARASIERSS